MKSLLYLFIIATLAACNRSPAVEQRASTPQEPTTTTTAVETTPTATPTPDRVVEDFGQRMKQVSTTASADIAAASIRKAYEGLVDPKLLNIWLAAPQSAPGRQASSPWPERIEIASTAVNRPRASVNGTLVEMTSTGEAGRTPVELELTLSDNTWRITAYRAAQPQDDATAAVDVVRNYYRAISARDFDRAYRAWGEGGPPGQDQATFAKGFEQTASVEVTTGTPSRVEGAAGSRYVEVPVVVTAKTTTGAVQRFEGTYTLRRSVVDGASAAQRAWHIHRASIRATKPE